MLFILLCFSLLCSYFVWVIMSFDPEGCCCLIQMDGIFFVFFFVFDDFFVFLYCLICCFSVGYVFYGDPEGACLIQMGRG